MMRKFNEEDFIKVTRYERDFERAVKSRYCTGLLKEELEICARIYQECLNRHANLMCGSCVLAMMTSVGRLYFSYKKTRDESVEEPQLKPEIDLTLRKPRTRKSKKVKKDEDEVKD